MLGCVMDSDELRHVAIQGEGRRVELPLPARAPVVELTPALARACLGVGAGPSPTGTPAAWTLARPGGPPMPLTASLAGEGVEDGEVLSLVDAASWRAVEVAELTDVLLGVAPLGPRWSARASALLLAGLGVLAMLDGAALAVWGAIGPKREGLAPAAAFAGPAAVWTAAAGLLALWLLASPPAVWVPGRARVSISCGALAVVVVASASAFASGSPAAVAVDGVALASLPWLPLSRLRPAGIPVQALAAGAAMVTLAAAIAIRLLTSGGQALPAVAFLLAAGLCAVVAPAVLGGRLRL